MSCLCKKCNGRGFVFVDVLNGITEDCSCKMAKPDMGAFSSQKSYITVKFPIQRENEV